MHINVNEDEYMIEGTVNACIASPRSSRFLRLLNLYFNHIEFIRLVHRRLP